MPPIVVRIGGLKLQRFLAILGKICNSAVRDPAAVSAEWVAPRLSDDRALAAAHLSAQRSKRAGYFVLLKLIKACTRRRIYHSDITVSELFGRLGPFDRALAHSIDQNQVAALRVYPPCFSCVELLLDMYPHALPTLHDVLTYVFYSILSPAGDGFIHPRTSHWPGIVLSIRSITRPKHARDETEAFHGSCNDSAIGWFNYPSTHGRICRVMRKVPRTYNVSSVADIPDYRDLVGADITGRVLHYTDNKENQGSAKPSDKLDDLRGYFSFRIHRRMDDEFMSFLDIDIPLF
ncbi:hypothetical protein PILCRDRAFT_5122 [Piloderma croceum F 1598]|uniref:Uncharacterized protein n=1 Tax=Piloderma croceum (strain F 1598) TaxID=765440 RepID=A0A0C3BIB6_PILCF|nr:hypothetical protein PILCRDRAFT_5122 [Piloderma croceum F 1598]